jgi:hypothetical protein
MLVFAACCQVQQRDVPGIDCAFLAMDNEEGVEVVWNEVRISEKKSSKVQLVIIIYISCWPSLVTCVVYSVSLSTNAILLMSSTLDLHSEF